MTPRRLFLRLTYPLRFAYYAIRTCRGYPIEALKHDAVRVALNEMMDLCAREPRSEVARALRPIMRRLFEHDREET